MHLAQFMRETNFKEREKLRLLITVTVISLTRTAERTGDRPQTLLIKRWFKNFMETGSILDRKRSGRPGIDKETVDAVRVAFHRSPRKSIRVASNELAIPRSTVHCSCSTPGCSLR